MRFCGECGTKRNVDLIVGIVQSLLKPEKMTTSDKIYYLAKPGVSQPEGPYSEQELYAFFSSRQLPTGSSIWKQGWSDWKPCELVFQWFADQTRPDQ